MNRRQFLTRSGCVVAGFAISQAIERFAVDPVLSPAAIAPFVASNLLPLFDRHASENQRIAMATWRKTGSLDQTVAALDTRQPFAVIDFAPADACYAAIGSGLSVLTRDMQGARVIDAPDAEYGRFVYQRAATVMVERKHAFQSCYGRLQGHARPVQYTSLMLPAGLRVLSVGHRIPASIGQGQPQGIAV